ncbi:MAG: GNAT family N-acetyltransferase, partial [Alphaproteobacteria bacterium]|nr:GNAT family N-acetyltransferase [Alphaproteobacteria bacterium]
MLAGQWQNYKVENLNLAQAQALRTAWAHLSAHATEPAGYNAPELILPLMQHLQGATLRAVRHGPDLLLAVPLAESKLYTKSWPTSLTASGLPHVSAELAESAVQCFLAGQSKPILLKAIPEEASFLKALKKQSAHFQIIESWKRAALQPSGTYEDWLQNNFDHKRRKEFKRLRNRLAEQGDLKLAVLNPPDDAQPYIDDLLALEAAGWKGTKGTAIAAHKGNTQALLESLNALHKNGKLRFWTLKLNGKPIASLFAIVEGDQ